MVTRVAAVVGAATAALALASAADAQTLLPAVRLQTSVSAGPHLFGDQVQARLDVFVDRSRADPDTLRIDTKFFPYTRVGVPDRAHARDGSTDRISYAYTLDCLTLACFPGDRKREARIDFPVAVVRYHERSGTPRGLAVRWPTFRLVSRLPPPTPAQRRRAAQSGVVFTASPASGLFAPVGMPAATYRLSPLLLAALLFAGTLLALAAAAFLGRPVVAELRRAAAVPEGPPLTSLERALERVERSAAKDGRGDRGALAWLARELPQAGLHDLVRRARRLAWSEHEPTADESLALARDVRAALEAQG
jgi:hypothetical protein